MKKKLLLFDVDGTICESGKKISFSMANLINNLKPDFYCKGPDYKKLKNLLTQS